MFEFAPKFFDKLALVNEAGGLLFLTFDSVGTGSTRRPGIEFSQFWFRIQGKDGRRT